MPKFDLYSAKLRLAGSVMNEIRKTDLTAPEIEVLKAIHGSDAVVDIKHKGNVSREHREERERIMLAYVNPADNLEGQARKKTAMIRELFGHDRLPLPTTIEDVESEASDDAAVEIAAVAAPIKRTRAPKEPTPSFAE